MPRPVKETNVVNQSNYITTARYEYTAMEKRILYRIVEKAFECREANKEWFAKHDGEYSVKEHKNFIMPISAFMTKEQQENGSGEYYDEIVAAFKSLVDKRINFIGKKKNFSFGGILNSADREIGEGTISFTVHKFVWQSALDFSKGFTRLDLSTAVQLKSPYSMRFYEIAKQWEDKGHFVINVEDFRELFGCVNKYDRLESLKRCLIEPSKKELDAVSPISFTYDQVKEGRKVKFFRFHFIRVPKNISANAAKSTLLSKMPHAALPKEIKDWLKYKLGMSEDQRTRNIKALSEFYEAFRDKALEELEETFQYIYNLGKIPNENIGWFIQNIRAKTENKKNK